MIQAVIFDIGNVLIRWQPETYYDARFGAGRRRELFGAVDLHGMNDRIDRGGDFREVVYETAAAYPDFAGEIRLWHDDWLGIAGPAIDDSVAVLRDLRAAGVPVFALSNFGIDSFALTETEYDFLQAFDRRYISGHMGVIKPEPEIYAMVEADCGIAPGGLLFADDRADNIAAAEARGWQGHLFRDPADWRARIVAEGLLQR